MFPPIHEKKKKNERASYCLSFCRNTRIKKKRFKKIINCPRRRSLCIFRFVFSLSLFLSIFLSVSSLCVFFFRETAPRRVYDACVRKCTVHTARKTGISGRGFQFTHTRHGQYLHQAQTGRYVEWACTHSIPYALSMSSCAHAHDRGRYTRTTMSGGV